MKGTKYIPSRNIETIKNHFLPKSYLQLFESKNGTILFYDKKTNEVHKATKNSIGFEKNIYNTKDKLGEKSYETFYKEFVDDTYSKIIKEIIARANLKITERPLASPILKNNIAKIIITQISRVPDMIYLMKDSYTETLENIDNQLSTSEELKKYSDIIQKYNDDAYYKDIVLGIMTDETRIYKFCNEILSKTWILFHNKSSIKFLTSDNPIVRYNYTTKNLRNGIARHDVLIGFPLTPEYYLVILPNSYLLGGIQLEADKCFIIGNESLSTINLWNGLQISNSTRFIYGNV